VQKLKSLQNPPADCLPVTKAILIFKSDRKSHVWPNAQKMMNNPKAFLESLQVFDGNNIDWKLLDDCAQIIALEGFTSENMKKKSSAAASLCT
jgi:dynein heavy chain, axonemal